MDARSPGADDEELAAGAPDVGQEDRPALHRAVTHVRRNSGLRYLLTGGALFFLDLGIYVALHTGLGVGIMTSQLISRTTGAAVGFVAHKFISFGGNGGAQSIDVASQGVAYTVVMGANILISPFLVAFLVSLASHPIPDERAAAIVGKLVSDAIIIAETYLLLRLIFHSPSDVTAETEP